MPDTAPEDPFERQDHLRALALVELATGARGSSSRDTVIAVVDGTTVDEDGNPDIQLPRGIELPDVILEQLVAAARVHPVLVNRGCIVWAPGKLNLGRTTRIANRDQRRALRAVHRTCVIPGCDVAFEHCEIHHVWWYDHHGPTDLALLAPVCVGHHHHIHHDGWDLAITADRRIIVILPDGTIPRTGPPRARAA
jgi:hypothetical protein